MLCWPRRTEIILTSNPVTPGIATIVTRAEAKAWLKVDGTDDDLLIDALIATAVTLAGQYTGRTFLVGPWTTEFDYFPAKLKLDVMPIDISSIVVKYLDADDVKQTLADTEYFVRDPGTDDFATIEFNGTIPQIFNKENAVFVEYDAGYATAPAPVKTAVLMQVATMYENRQNEVIGSIINEIVNGARQLLFPYKLL
jgi:uncharacterized phiE125 gp8 family phage protein